MGIPFPQYWVKERKRGGKTIPAHYIPTYKSHPNVDTTPSVSVQEVIDNRETRQIIEKLGSLKWDYEVTLSFNRNKIHKAPWGDTTIGEILDTVIRAGYEPLRSAYPDGVAAKRAIKGLEKIFEKELSYKRRPKGRSIRREIQREVGRRLKADVADDIRNSTDWLFLDKNTIRARMWKEDVYPEHAKYPSGITHPMVESGQFVKALTIDVHEVEHSNRMNISLNGMSEEEKQKRRDAFWHGFSDSASSVSERSMGIVKEGSGNLAQADGTVVKRHTAQAPVVHRGAPSMDDIMSGRAGSGEVGGFFDDDF